MTQHPHIRASSRSMSHSTHPGGHAIKHLREIRSFITRRPSMAKKPTVALDLRIAQIDGGGAGRGAAVIPSLHAEEREYVDKLRPRPALHIGTSIGAWIAMAISAGKLDTLTRVFEGIDGRGDAMRLDLNPFDGDGIGYDLDRLIDLASAAGIGEGMRTPVYVGVVNLTEWQAPTSPHHLPGHHLVRVDQMTPKDAQTWAARSSAQRPFHKWVGTREDGPQWADGGLAAPNPPLPTSETRKINGILLHACSPMLAALRREKRTVDDIRSPLRVMQLAVDHLIDRNVMLDLARFTDYACSGIPVEARWPVSMADVREPFDLSKATMQHRLGPAGNRLRDNVHRIGPDGKIRNAAGKVVAP